MHHYDLMITKGINQFAGTSPLLDAFFLFLTTIGVPIMVILVAIQWWRTHDRSAVRHTVIAAGLTFLFGLAINQIILIFVHRMRPYDAGITHLLIAPSADYAFPSDHATASFAIAIAFLLQGLRRWAGAFLILSGLICLSRIYVGTHYFTDILGGALTAGFAAILVKSLYWEGTRIDRKLTSIF